MQQGEVVMVNTVQSFRSGHSFTVPDLCKLVPLYPTAEIQQVKNYFDKQLNHIWVNVSQ